MRAFADALDAVPMALAENSGLSPIETLAYIKSRQAKEKNSRLGVDCMQTGSNGKLLFQYTFIIDHIPTRVSSLYDIPGGIRGICFLLFSPPFRHLARRSIIATAWSRGAYSLPCLKPPWDVVPNPHVSYIPLLDVTSTTIWR